MNKKICFCKYFYTSILFACLLHATAYAAGVLPHQSKAIGKGGDIRVHPYLFNGFSRKNLSHMRTSSPYGYSILNCGRNKIDTLKIIAVRVEFQIDSSYSTTGNGLFGIFRTSKGTREDRNEWEYYNNKSYVYDNLPHDSLYFANQLEYVKKYFWKVSKGQLLINYTIFPKGRDEEHAYKVPEKMPKYSPGAKKKKESWDDYYLRRTIGLMKFVRDAIRASDADSDSPFKNLVVDQSTGHNSIYEQTVDTVTNDTTRTRAAILIFHAGASYLTDGGWNGLLYQNTPSDMIDAFVSTEFFDYFASDTSIGLDTLSGIAGLLVNKNAANQMIIDEVMMVSETSNQDSLNWGIHGILVNQIARQIGIPDLFSTMSGISGIGSFCIMDFAGYSSGRGFIPPWPSAWVRAYMGWDSPKIVEPGNVTSTATLTSISTAEPTDTSIVLVPINNHEYYLIENRQRNLTGDTTFFNYDTLEGFDPDIDGSVVISPYDQVNLEKNVLSTFPTTSNVIDSVYNYDISIPAAGILIWHTDEYIIRDHLEQNVVNADSSYRGISLEEADGVVDLGVMFQDIFYQAVFDYGGAADVFPHYTSESSDVVNMMGPFTRPSTQSNDGGHTYLKIKIDPKSSNIKKEVMVVEGNLVYNYPDSTFTVTVESDTSSVSSLANWPIRIVPDKSYEPVLCNVYTNGDTLELAVVDTSGRVYIRSAEGDNNLFCGEKEVLPSLLYSNDTLYRDTISFLGRVPHPASMPTGINTQSLYIPSKDGNIYILRSLDSTSAIWDTVRLGQPLSSYVCNYSGTNWAVGCTNGTIVFGDDATGDITTINTSSSAPVQSFAVVNATNGKLAAVNSAGELMIVSPQKVRGSCTLGSRKITNIFPPFSLAAADLDQDTVVDIVVCDRKQGVWLLNYDERMDSLFLDREWVGWPNDWAGSHRLDTARAAIPDNESAPSIADLDKDNVLDIIIGGTNGIYAYNHRGVLLVEWPALLDTRFWYQRGSVKSTPTIAFEPNTSDPLIVFSSPTGENVTFAIAHIDSSNLSTGTVYYTRNDGIIDSVTGLSESFIDSLLVIGDSLVFPYIMPGGYIDAFNMHAKRPTTINTLPNVGKEIQSGWPFTVGGSISTSPLLCDMDNDTKTDIIAVSDGGWVHRWEVSSSILGTSFVWAQAGSNNSRTFAYAGPVNTISHSDENQIKYLYNYPNPVKGAKSTTFKYQLTSPATRVRLDIFTYTGYHILSERSLPSGFGWNEYTISIKKFGSAVYRCRLEASFNGKKKVKYWKMAVMK